MSVQDRGSQRRAGTGARYLAIVLTFGLAAALVAVIVPALPDARDGLGSLPGSDAAASTSAALSPSALPSSFLSPGGLSPDEAIEIARQHAPRDAVLVSTTAAPFGDVDEAFGHIGPGFPVTADRLVWAVAFDSVWENCPPDGSACWTPRPGRTTVILDYFTGDFLVSGGVSRP